MVPNAATPITSTTTPQRSRRLTLLSETEVVRRLGFIPAPVLSRPALLPLAMPVTFHRTSARTTLRRWPHRPSCLPPGGVPIRRTVDLRYRQATSSKTADRDEVRGFLPCGRRGSPHMAGLGRPADSAAALADCLEDLLKPGDAWGQDRAPGDDRAHIYQDGVRHECAEVKLRNWVVRLEDNDLITN